jgi:hypothetical protein
MINNNRINIQLKYFFSDGLQIKRAYGMSESFSLVNPTLYTAFGSSFRGLIASSLAFEGKDP